MVMTVANLIRVPLLLFTKFNAENMPTMVITPALSVACTQLPLYLVFNAAGQGQYDYAVPTESIPLSFKPLKMFLWKESQFSGRRVFHWTKSGISYYMMHAGRL